MTGIFPLEITSYRNDGGSVDMSNKDEVSGIKAYWWQSPSHYPM